jgi:hypothetical protein
MRPVFDSTMPLRFVALLLCLTAVVRAETKEVAFAGVTYHLASVDVAKDGTVTNEYVPRGESIDDWSTLLAVRVWPRAKKLAEPIQAWMTMIHPLLVRDANVYQRKEQEGQELIAEAWLAAPDHSYIEINLHRFVLQPKARGVKAYQFAQKIVMKDGQGNPTSFIEHRSDLFTALGALQLEAVTKKY